MEILIPEKKESECDCVVIKRGDIFYADLRPVVGSEQGFIRPNAQELCTFASSGHALA